MQFQLFSFVCVGLWKKKFFWFFFWLKNKIRLYYPSEAAHRVVPMACASVQAIRSVSKVFFFVCCVCCVCGCVSVCIFFFFLKSFFFFFYFFHFKELLWMCSILLWCVRLCVFFFFENHFLPFFISRIAVDVFDTPLTVQQMRDASPRTPQEVKKKKNWNKWTKQIYEGE